MAKKFSELRAQMSPDAQRRADTAAQSMLAEKPLHDLLAAVRAVVIRRNAEHSHVKPVA